MTITIADVKREFPHCIVEFDNVGNIFIRTSTINHSYREEISVYMQHTMDMEILQYMKENLRMKIMLDEFKSYCDKYRHGNIIVSPHIERDEIVVHPEKHHKMLQYTIDKGI